MSFEEILEKWKVIYQNILEFLDIEDDSEVHLNEFNNILNDQSIRERKEDISTFLHLLISIANNHHRSSNFFVKIDQILKLFRTEIQHFYTNIEIFTIFRGNKRILLFLIEERILTLDESIVFTISNGWYKAANYHFYFYPEIENFLIEKKLQKMSNKTSEMKEVNSNNFEDNRKSGENSNYICKLIQADEIDEFVIHVNKTNYPLSNTIENSIFETNSYLLNKETSLIEYAAFYGSIQIFKYLYLNKVDISPLLWIYSIHGRNADIIHLLEEYQIQPFDLTFNQILKESIKCHHNEIAHYIQNNKLTKKEGLSISIKYSNFEFLSKEEIDEFGFYFACKNNDVFIADYILNNASIDVNAIFTDGNIQQTALCAAVRERNKEIVHFLLSIPKIDVNVKSIYIVDGLEEEKRKNYKKDKTPLIIAVCENDEEIVELLLSNQDIDVNATVDYYDVCDYAMHHIEKSALNIAIEKGKVKIVSLLLSHPQICVNQICRHNDGDYGVDEGHDRFIEKIPLILAVEKENIEIISLLLNHPKIDINIKSRYHDYQYIKHFGYRGNQYKERTALSIAVDKNNAEIVHLLLKHSKIKLNYQLLFYNSNHSDQDEDEYKTDHYFYVDDYEGDIACEAKKEELRNFPHLQPYILQFNEIQPKMIFSRSFIKEIKSPLFVSVQNNNMDIINLLLNCSNIDVNYTSVLKSVEISDEISPLQEAVNENNEEIIQLLKKHNAVEIKKRYRDELDLII